MSTIVHVHHVHEWERLRDLGGGGKDGTEEEGTFFAGSGSGIKGTLRGPRGPKNHKSRKNHCKA